AFMWAINGLVLDAARDRLRDEVSVLYVSPLKALANDIRLNLEEPLDAVRDVIVDELHALAGNKRGAHLALTLERLERFVTSRGNARPNRIGLSATLNPIEKLAGFLAGYGVARDGSRSPRPIKIVRADDRVRTMDLQVIVPGPELGPLATDPHWEAMYDEVARLIGEHRTTLVFTLSRRFAERVALN